MTVMSFVVMSLASLQMQYAAAYKRTTKRKAEKYMCGVSKVGSRPWFM